MTKILERIKFVKEIIKDKQEEYDFLIETDKESANYILTDMKLYEEILNDLEENEILKQSVKDTYDSSQEIIFDLKKENQELKELVESLNMEQILQVESIFDLEIENEKLKKAIEIIKKHDIKPINHLGCLRFGYNEYNCHLTDEEYELLKEVLE